MKQFHSIQKDFNVVIQLPCLRFMEIKYGASPQPRYKVAPAASPMATSMPSLAPGKYGLPAEVFSYFVGNRTTLPHAHVSWLGTYPAGLHHCLDRGDEKAQGEKSTLWL